MPCVDSWRIHGDGVTLLTLRRGRNPYFSGYFVACDCRRGPRNRTVEQRAARPEVQTDHRGLSKEACAESRRQRNRDVFVFVYRAHSSSGLHHSSVSLCSFKQIRSWVERPRCCYLWCRDSALTSVDVMLHWEMSCHLMEQLPVAARAAAMCVNLFPRRSSVFPSIPTFPLLPVPSFVPHRLLSLYCTYALP